MKNFILGFLAAITLIAISSYAQSPYGMMNFFEIEDIQRILKRWDKEGIKCKNPS